MDPWYSELETPSSHFAVELTHPFTQSEDRSVPKAEDSAGHLLASTSFDFFSACQRKLCSALSYFFAFRI